MGAIESRESIVCRDRNAFTLRFHSSFPRSQTLRLYDYIVIMVASSTDEQLTRARRRLIRPDLLLTVKLSWCVDRVEDPNAT
jgi:hypothetical protein